MIVAEGQNDLVQVPVDGWANEIIEPIKPPYVIEIEEADLVAILLIKSECLLIRELVMQFDPEILYEQVKRDFGIGTDQWNIAVETVIFGKPLKAQSHRKPQ